MVQNLIITKYLETTHVTLYNEIWYEMKFPYLRGLADNKPAFRHEIDVSSYALLSSSYRNRNYQFTQALGTMLSRSNTELWNLNLSWRYCRQKNDVTAMQKSSSSR